jgi:hypothetical protein
LGPGGGPGNGIAPRLVLHRSIAGDISGAPPISRTESRRLELDCDLNQAMAGAAPARRGAARGKLRRGPGKDL